jgi:archaellum biogenesis ATPase FlaH
MAEKVNTGLEKIFFLHILENPQQFEKVDSHFFKNEDIQFIYNIIREDFLVSKNKISPTPQQILAMIKLHDTKISNEFIKTLLKGDNSSYEKEWMESRFKAWKISNSCKDNVMKSIEYIRGLNEIDYDNVLDVTNKIKNMFGDLSLIDSDDNDLGEDFDDPDSHKITSSTRKMATGWSCVDKILSGGWDQASMSVLMGETNVGKSMWMQNIGVKAADQGANVVYITLEMGSQKCMKRMGSMRLKIPIDDYDEKSKDTIFMKNRINNLKSMNSGMFSEKPGKIFVKKYNTGSCTITEIDNYITKLEEVKKIKVNMVLIDYISLMGIEKGLDFSSMLFLKGKHLAEGIRFIADKHNCALITATQTDKAVWGANDIDLKNMPESKAIAETADSVWAIIRNPEMKKNNTYRLKILKLRDGEHKGEQIRFKFNTTYLCMEDDEFVGNA